MSRPDDLRHTLHDPDYWLGPPEPLGARLRRYRDRARRSTVRPD